MKTFPIQEDFSAGELSPKAQGHVTADFYKAGAKLMSNCLPTRGGSVASRAGGRHVIDALGLGVPGVGPVTDVTHGNLRPGTTQYDSRGRGVQHFAIHDGPYGDFVLEAGPHYFRILDKHKGVRTWHRPILDTTAPEVVYGEVNDVHSDCWGDPGSDTVYLNNRDGVGQRSWKVNARLNENAVLVVDATDPGIGWPLGTNENFTLTGCIAGDPLTLRITTDEMTRDTVLPVGHFSVDVNPINPAGSNIPKPFTVTFLQEAGAVRASSVWGVSISKNGMQTISSLLSRPGQMRVESFWVSHTDKEILVDGLPVKTVLKQFMVVIVGGGVPLVLVWTGYPSRNDIDQPDTVPLMTEWMMMALPFKGGTPSWAAAVSSVVAYQNRLWFGLDDKNGSLHASEVGFGSTTAGTSDGITDAGEVFQFEFRLPGKLAQEKRIIANAGQTDFPFTIATRDTSQVSVTKDGAAVDFRAQLNGDQDFDPGGHVYLDPSSGGETVIITIKPLLRASDPLDLTLATPTGRIVWMNVLHGLVLGSTRMEKQFQQGITLALDPAIGAAFDILDHSSLGSDELLPAVNVNQKILFFQRGRQILREMSVRYMWESGLPQGGLVADDVSALGEHLLKRRVRSFCFLKSPTPRLVFAFDDGTGAVATLGGKVGYAWSRLSIPAALGGIYSVCALNGVESSELWVGTGCGVTLQFDVVESDITVKTRVVAGILPFADTVEEYDAETPLPPTMDGWLRSGLVPYLPSTIYAGMAALDLPEVFKGQNVYVIINGEKYGPYQANSNPALYNGVVYVVVPNADLPGLAATWVDEDGVTRVTQVYVGAAYPEHKWVGLVQEGGNPAGSAQSAKVRRPQLYLRFVDSYMPLVNGDRPDERQPDDAMNLFASRVTGDVRCTELGFKRGSVIEVEMDFPLRFEVSAMFGGTQVNTI